MPDELNGARVKLQRALEQLETIQTEVGTFLGREPYLSFVDVDDERREIAFGIEVREQPNPMFSVITGEILHNLRSSLDHALWQLVLHDGGSPHDRTGFPIYLSSRGFDSERTSTSRRRGMLDGLLESSIKEIETLQPFQTGENSLSPLWQLHQLHNFDKHRTLILAAAQLRKVKASVSPLAAGVIPSQETTVDFGPFEQDAIITRLSIPSWFVDSPTVDVETPAEFGLAFGKGSPTPGLPFVGGLAAIGARVYECVKRIDALF